MPLSLIFWITCRPLRATGSQKKLLGQSLPLLSAQVRAAWVTVPRTAGLPWEVR